MFTFHWHLQCGYYTSSFICLFLLIQPSSIPAKVWVGVATASARWYNDRLSANQSISDREDSFPHIRLSQLVKNCLHLFGLIIVESRQSCILLLQPFKLTIVQQRIILHRLYLLFGFFPIQFFNLTDNLHESAGDISILLLNPFVNTEYRRFTSDSWRLKIYLVIAERLRHSTDTVNILCHLFQFLLLFLKLACLVFKFGVVFGNLFLYPGLLNFIFLKSDFAGSQRLLNFFKLRLRPE